MTACSDNSESKQKQDGTPEISVENLNRLVSAGEDFFLLDVRTMPEFTADRLEFSDRLVPYDELSKYLSLIPSDKNSEIHCFCRTGRRSEIATQYLISQGYTNVHNVAGGIHAWVAAGYPTVSGPAPKDMTGP